MEITLANPAYMIGNPNSEDNPPVSGDPAPGIIHTSVDPAQRLVLLAGQVGLLYTYPMKFLANATQAWSVSAGSLPAGLTLDGSTGIISGTPTTEQQADFTITVVTGIPATVSQAFSITIFLAPIPVDPGGVVSFACGTLTGDARFHFQHGGAWYVMMNAGDRSGTQNLAIYKSADGGLTFTRLDEANEPAAPTGGSGRLTALVLGQAWDGLNTIYCCYAPVAVTSVSFTVTMKKFDLVTGTWQADFGGAVTLLGENTPWMYLAILTTGVIRLIFCSPGPVAMPKSLQFMDNNGSAFTGPVTLATPAVRLDSITYQPRSFLDNSVIDVCHIWYQSSGGTPRHYTYLRLDSAGTGTSAFTAPTADYIDLGGVFSGSALLESSF